MNMQHPERTLMSTMDHGRFVHVGSSIVTSAPRWWGTLIMGWPVEGEGKGSDPEQTKEG